VGRPAGIELMRRGSALFWHDMIEAEDAKQKE
jgi:hypothetical protein